MEPGTTDYDQVRSLSGLEEVDSWNNDKAIGGPVHCHKLCIGSVGTTRQDL